MRQPDAIRNRTEKRIDAGGMQRPASTRNRALGVTQPMQKVCPDASQRSECGAAVSWRASQSKNRRRVYGPKGRTCYGTTKPGRTGLRRETLGARVQEDCTGVHCHAQHILMLHYIYHILTCIGMGLRRFADPVEMIVSLEG